MHPDDNLHDIKFLILQMFAEG